MFQFCNWRLCDIIGVKGSWMEATTKMGAEEDEGALKRVFYGLDASGGAFSGFGRFWRAVKQKLPHLQESTAKRFYDSQRLVQTHKPVKRAHLFRPILVNGLGQWLSMDGIYVGPKHGFNKLLYGYTGMDLATRKLDLFFTHSLSAVQAVKALQQFIETFKCKPVGVHLFTDFGAEMTGAIFSSFCAQAGIKHYFNNPSSKNKTSILERSHRTLRAIAYRIMRAPPDLLEKGLGNGKRSVNMVEALQAAVEVFNHSYSRSIGMAPNDVNEQNYAQVLVHQQKQRAKRIGDYISKELERRSGDMWTVPIPSVADLPVDTLVRIRLQALVTEQDQARRHSFSKEFSSITYSSQVYRITGALPSSPVSYTVASTDSSFVMPFSFTRNQLVVVQLPSEKKNGGGS
jgi:transposase InsO family protein